MTAHARVTIGQPIDLSSYFGRESDREVLAELTKRFLKEIAHLAKDDSFEPQLAGKRWHPDDFASRAADDGSEADNHLGTGEWLGGPRRLGNEQWRRRTTQGHRRAVSLALARAAAVRLDWPAPRLVIRKATVRLSRHARPARFALPPALGREANTVKMGRPRAICEPAGGMSASGGSGAAAMTERKCATASELISRSRRAKRICLPQAICWLDSPPGATSAGIAGSAWPAHAGAWQASSDWRLARSRISTDAV